MRGCVEVSDGSKPRRETFPLGKPVDTCSVGIATWYWFTTIQLTSCEITAHWSINRPDDVPRHSAVSVGTGSPTSHLFYTSRWRPGLFVNIFLITSDSLFVRVHGTHGNTAVELIHRAAMMTGSLKWDITWLGHMADSCEKGRRWMEPCVGCTRLSLRGKKTMRN